MTEITAYLSPNGQNMSRSDGPVTRILVATVEGVVTLRRPAPGAPWALEGRSLAALHIGSLLYEPASGKLFAGAHADGGLWLSDDGEGRAGAGLPTASTGRTSIPWRRGAPAMR